MRSRQTSECYMAAIGMKAATGGREVAFFKRDLTRRKTCGTWGHVVFLVQHVKEERLWTGVRVQGDPGGDHGKLPKVVTSCETPWG